MIKNIIKESVKIYYRHLGIFIIINFVCFLCSLTFVLFPSAFMSCFVITRKMIEDEDVSVKIYFKEIFNNFWHKSLVFCFAFFVISVSIYSLFFYMHLPFNLGIWINLFIGLSGFFLLFLICACIYLLPLSCNKDYFKINDIKKAVILPLIKFPIITLGILFFLIIINLIFVFSYIGILIFLHTFNCMVLIMLCNFVFKPRI